MKHFTPEEIESLLAKVTNEEWIPPIVRDDFTLKAPAIIRQLLKEREAYRKIAISAYGLGDTEQQCQRLMEGSE